MMVMSVCRVCLLHGPLDLRVIPLRRRYISRLQVLPELLKLLGERTLRRAGCRGLRAGRKRLGQRREILLRRRHISRLQILAEGPRV